MPWFIGQLPPYLLFCVVLGLLVGCGIFADKEDTEKARDLYQTGRIAMQEGRNQDAIERFKKLENQYPFSTYAKEASLSLAYLHYKNRSYEKAEVSIEQFIRLNPDSQNLDYAYYLRGLIHYNYSQGFLSVLIRADVTTKNPEHMVKAFDSFKILHSRFPDSQYAAEARQRAIVLRDLLAVYELRIADYYMQRNMHTAVANRIKYLLEHYPGAQHTPEALVLLTEAYRRMGLTQLSEDTLAVLALNYPGYYENNLSKHQDTPKGLAEKLKNLTKKIAEGLKLKSRY